MRRSLQKVRILILLSFATPPFTHCTHCASSSRDRITERLFVLLRLQSVFCVLSRITLSSVCRLLRIDADARLTQPGEFSFFLFFYLSRSLKHTRARPSAPYNPFQPHPPPASVAFGNPYTAKQDNCNTPAVNPIVFG